MPVDEQALLDSARHDLAAAGSNDLDQIKSAYLGKQGHIGVLLRQIGALPPDQRSAAGESLNRLRLAFTELLETRRTELADELLAQRLHAGVLDVTLPGHGHAPGSRHPVSLVTERATAIFASMGFTVADGPEIEDDFHNFEALNHPHDHPARSMHDTFYLTDGRLLRTHTSPVQIRYMLNHQPPLRAIAPGRVYRVDNDATHSPMFHQLESIWVDDQVRFSDLKGVMLEFFREFFEDAGIDIRFRPSYFPFTEPSAEVDIRFSGKDWLEVAGCGMVHPNVLTAGGIDPTVYQGFAFGVGLDRLAMLRYDFADIRALFENDVRFLRQFT